MNRFGLVTAFGRCGASHSRALGGRKADGGFPSGSLHRHRHLPRGLIDERLRSCLGQAGDGVVEKGENYEQQTQVNGADRRGPATIRGRGETRIIVEGRFGQGHEGGEAVEERRYVSWRIGCALPLHRLQGVMAPNSGGHPPTSAASWWSEPDSVRWKSARSMAMGK